jgi:tetratricopeptide (TPR) repeat protein
VRLLLFDLALKDGDEGRMDRALEEIRNVEQGGAFHRYGRALRLIWRVKNHKTDREALLQQARLELDRVLTQRPSWPPAYLARAEIAELRGNKEEAIKDLQEALKNGETSLGAVRRLVTLLSEKGRHKEAQQVLDNVSALLRANVDLQKIAVGVAFARQEVGRALELARTLMDENSRNPQDLVWMAQVHALAREPGKAEAKLRKAIEVAPEDPIAYVALVQFLAGDKKRKPLERKADAEKVIERARGRVPAGQLPLALARCYEAARDFERAQKHFREALKASPGDVAVVRTVAGFYLGAGRLKEAEPLLRRLVDRKLRDVSDADQEWAKRSLATLLASGNDLERLREALELVGLRLDEEGRLPREDPPEENTENLRARARVLASQAGRQRQFRLKAIGVLEGLAARRALQPDDQYLLALLYDAEGQGKKSLEKLSELTQPEKRTPQFLAQHILALTQSKQPDDLIQADKLLRLLEGLEKEHEVGPNGFASVDLRARLLEARGKKAAAIDLLQNHAARAGAKPEEVLLVLAALGRQKKFAKALTICEEQWEAKKVAPEALGGVSVALVRAMGEEVTDRQVERVEGHLKDAIEAERKKGPEKNPRVTVMRMHLADLYDRRGRYAEAEQQYRAVLKAEPNNVVALNNLAWLLVVWRRGEAEQALAHIDRAINGMGRRPDLLDTRALVHLALKQPAKAVADLKEATADAPTPTRLFHLARAYHEARDRTAAGRTLREANKKGLTPEALHPVEQQACKDLFAAYDIR